VRLRGGGGLARAVTLKVRSPDFATSTRQRTLAAPTDETLAIWRAAEALLNAWLAERPGALRLLGVSVERTETAPTEATLFDAAIDDRQRRVDAVTDEVARRFGPDALRRGGSRAGGRRSPRDATDRGPRPESG
jgi:DNA polymerase-4